MSGIQQVNLSLPSGQVTDIQPLPEQHNTGLITLITQLFIEALRDSGKLLSQKQREIAEAELTSLAAYGKQSHTHQEHGKYDFAGKFCKAVALGSASVLAGGETNEGWKKAYETAGHVGGSIAEAFGSLGSSHEQAQIAGKNQYGIESAREKLNEHNSSKQMTDRRLSELHDTALQAIRQAIAGMSSVIAGA
ncbi:MAG: hypothetical protein K9M07_00775 [Simkaniaceae bacterium]|nr:hypothetical protein [Simkaniaceae bacterium]